MRLIYHFIFAFILLYPLGLLAQGTPFIDTYLKEDYDGGQANRGFVMDKTGMLHIANSKGLLSFDGTRFSLVPLSNKTPVLSIAVDDNNIILAGGQGEFGYFLPDDKGALKYRSLKNLLPDEHLEFSDIRHIAVENGKAYFKSLQRVFVWDVGTENMKVLQNSSTLEFLGNTAGKIWVDDQSKGIRTLEGDTYSKVKGGEIFADKEVTCVLELGDKLLLGTWSRGFYKLEGDSISNWQTTADAKLKGLGIKTAVPDLNGGLVVGTISGGILFLDKEGNEIQYYSQENGLRSNAVQALLFDALGNLWVGTENGFHYLRMGEPFRYISPDLRQVPYGYAVKVFNGVPYFATSQGLYKHDSNGFSRVPGGEGLCWNLSEWDGRLFLHKHFGLFEVKSSGVVPVRASGPGSWLLKDWKNGYLEGTYFGLVYHPVSGEEEEFRLNESCRIFEMEGDDVWISHVYKGVFKVSGTDGKFKDFKRYDSKDGFPSDIGINLSKIDEQIVFTTERGIYFYDKETDRMLPHENLNAVFGEDCQLTRLVDDGFGRLWYVENKEVGYVDATSLLTKGEWEKIPLPPLKGRLIENFEYIYPYSKERVLFGSESGFIAYFPEEKTAPILPKARITEIMVGVNLDSLLFGGYFMKNGTPSMEQSRLPEISFRDNNLKFRLASDDFSRGDGIMYSTKLDGFDRDWLDWTDSPERSITQLPAGNYLFWVKAKRKGEEAGEAVSYAFRIKAPWYATNLAKLMYFLFALFLIYLIWWIPRDRHEKETRNLQERQKEQLESREKEYERRVKESEEELVRLRTEKLESEVKFKNSELASSTMALVQKGEILLKIKEELSKITNLESEKAIRDGIRKIIRTIEKDFRLDDDWDSFEQYFDQVHTDFIKRLREKFPQLTPKDYRLCAYLRMNLSSKEIATLLNITTRSVEVSRYRLRKKLDLDSSVNLVDFIMDV